MEGKIEKKLKIFLIKKNISMSIYSYAFHLDSEQVSNLYNTLRDFSDLRDKILPSNAFVVLYNTTDNTHFIIARNGAGDIILAGSTPNFKDYITKLEENGMDDMSDDNIYKNYKNAINNLMIEAARNGNLVLVKIAIDYGADPSYNNSEALKWAINNGHFEITTYLIKEGANLKHINDNATMEAAKKGDLNIIRYLTKN